MSHTRTVASSEAERTHVRFVGENRTDCTGCLWPSNERRTAREPRSNSWINPVASPAARILPSGRTSAEYAVSLKREMVLETVRDLAEKIWTRAAEETTMSWGVEGEKDMWVTAEWEF